eukprot:Amastigsp_a176486_15.p3 type:complete len:131 gc:universal Amastigsp_a176486_15:758-366(-)
MGAEVSFERPHGPSTTAPRLFGSLCYARPRCGLYGSGTLLQCPRSQAWRSESLPAAYAALVDLAPSFGALFAGLERAIAANDVWALDGPSSSFGSRHRDRGRSPLMQDASRGPLGHVFSFCVVGVRCLQP